ncbi:ATP synthase subunit I [Desulfobulbus elongatus]|uniref:ATP synthase subunit I n=1 Tax=Desulfobulbus elongatus TaxID=53332 RepID=UPI00048A3C75|nr:ATP synthase subunit I [Desulfobulbus elongatus]
MAEQGKDADRNAGGRETAMVRCVTVGSMLLVGVFAAGGWFLQDWFFARSLLIGGVLVNGSFWLMQKDARRLLQRVGEAGEDAVITAEKTRFMLRSFARLVVAGLLLFVLATRMPIDVIGLILGCATIMVSVVIVGLGAGRRWLPSKV